MLAPYQSSTRRGPQRCKHLAIINRILRLRVAMRGESGVLGISQRWVGDDDSAGIITASLAVTLKAGRINTDPTNHR
jgi:hypothetical protein